MSGYIVRIVLLLGLVILVGACVAPGDAENYKVLDQEPERFNTEPDARLDQSPEVLALVSIPAQGLLYWPWVPATTL